MRTLLGLAVISPFALAACETKQAPKQKPPASASVAAALPPLPPSALVAPIEVPLCRVIAARGPSGASDAGAPAPRLGTALAGREFIDLGAGTEITLRHGTTTRELTLRGPGRFLPCFQGTETVLVASGTVKTTAGAGARAGAEVILATPFGALHFADAALELRVGERELDVRVETGTATYAAPSEPGRAADAGAAESVLGPKSRRKVSRTAAAPDLAAACTRAARSLGTAPPPPPSGAASARALLGQWSVTQLKARQETRWACAIARAAAGRLDEPERGRLWGEIAASDPVWREPR